MIRQFISRIGRFSNCFFFFFFFKWHTFLYESFSKCWTSGDTLCEDALALFFYYWSISRLIRRLSAFRGFILTRLVSPVLWSDKRFFFAFLISKTPSQPYFVFFFSNCPYQPDLPLANWPDWIASIYDLVSYLLSFQIGWPVTFHLASIQPGLLSVCHVLSHPLSSALSLSSLTRPPPPFSIDFCPCPSVFHSHSFIRLPFAVSCSEFNSFPAAAAVPFFAPFQSIHSDRQLSPSSSIQQKKHPTKCRFPRFGDRSKTWLTTSRTHKSKSEKPQG